MAIASEISKSTLQLEESEYMNGLSESLRSFTYNAVTGSADPFSLFQAGVRVAKGLGYDDESPLTTEGFNGVILASGVHHNRQYVPGVNDYTPEDHVRGVTATILDSGLTPFAKTFLISRAVDATDTTRPSVMQQFLDGYTIPSDKGIRERDARQIALDELDAVRARTGFIGVETTSQELAIVSGILRHEWHPYRSKVALGAFGLAVAGLAVVIRSKRHQ